MIRRTALVLAALCLVAACGADSNDAKSASPSSSSSSSGAPAKQTITLVTHDSFKLTKKLLTDFTKRTGITVKILQSGDAGSALNQAILTKDHPQGDVFFGVDNTFLSRALDHDLFVPYEPERLADVAANLVLDPDHRVTPIDTGDVCLNADKSFFADRELAVPKGLDDLIDPKYKDQLVVENPATSSPGLAFLLATIAEYGEDGYEDYWAKLRANGVQVDDDWDTAYYGDFSGAGGSKGNRPLVVSYASSPPAEVIFSDPKVTDAPTVTLPDTCFRQIEFAGILTGTEHEAAARQFIDFLLTRPVQEDIPLQMYVYPAVTGTKLPPEFVKYSTVPESPYTLDPTEIAANREEWINGWTEVVVR